MMPEPKVFRVVHAIGRAVEGPALVSRVPFSARYDLDWEAGRFSRLGHPLDGESIAGKILISPGVQGGVAAGWAFLRLASGDAGFRGLVFGRINPVMVQGAQAAGTPIASGVDEAIFEHVENGTIVQLDPYRLRVKLRTT
jgi:phosphomecalonate degydratase small subunit